MTRTESRREGGSRPESPSLLVVGPDAAAIAARIQDATPAVGLLVARGAEQALSWLESVPVHAIVASFQDGETYRLLSAVHRRFPAVVRILVASLHGYSSDVQPTMAIATFTIGPHGVTRVPTLVRGARA